MKLLIWRIVSMFVCLAVVSLAGCGGLGKLEQREVTEMPTPVVTSVTTPYYISTPTVTPSVTPSATLAPTIFPVTGRVTSFALHVRAGPGVAYSVIGWLSEGDEVKIVGANASGTWLQILHVRAGWVKAKFVEVEP